jgi:hypothetical protein
VTAKKLDQDAAEKTKTITKCVEKSIATTLQLEAAFWFPAYPI